MVCDGDQGLERFLLGDKGRSRARGKKRHVLTICDVEMLQATSSEKRAFIYIDALYECMPGNRVKLLDSLKQILEKSPCTRIFIIGRPHIQAEIEKRLAGRVISVSVGPSSDDIIGYIRVRLDEDETPDAMDESLAADIMEKIPENMSEMYVGAKILRIFS